MRFRLGRTRFGRGILALAVSASVTVPVSWAARAAAVPAPAPVGQTAIPSATAATLAERYAVSRDDIRVARLTAESHGHRRRAARLHALADPERQFLWFDGRNGGRFVEVFGDLAGAERIAVLVPGTDTNLDTYGRLMAQASTLQQAVGTGGAVIAWVGYETPGRASLDMVTTRRAEHAAPRLRRFVEQLHDAKPTARISLLCHSYGAVVCGGAAPDLPVADVIFVGASGVGIDSADKVHTTARVWAGRSGRDWIAHVPQVRLRLPFVTIGLGTDPLSEEFGARIFDAGHGGHSDYLMEGSVSLENLARIVAGQAPTAVPT
ncbi:alpha/beta hydrolase [Actinopolymorpha alba]|uniref:alpha/beta hydrolase n=1 Tax=Actinopolymorpha alba TaxID=533267 RepID=UPI00037A1C9A|nr:alpha/beta hydrolase [Actinopolymorpha alba]